MGATTVYDSGFWANRTWSLWTGRSRGLGGYMSAIHALAQQLQEKVRPGGYCVLSSVSGRLARVIRFPSEVLTKIFAQHASALRLDHVISDIIPDIRRSRRHLAGVRRHILVFQKG